MFDLNSLLYTLQYLFIISDPDKMPGFVGDDSEWVQHKKPEQEPVSLPVFDGKNPIMQLNELYHGLTYTFRDPVGPVHAATYHVSVEVEGQSFQACCNSKKSAKLAVANIALETLKSQGILDAREQERAQNKDVKLTKRRDFMSKRSDMLQERIQQYKNRDRKNPPLPKNAIVKLNDRYRSLEYKLVSQTGPSFNTTFTMSVSVENKTYFGTGRSKKRAKMEAAETVLKGMGLWTEEDEEIKKAVIQYLEEQTEDQSLPVNIPGEKRGSGTAAMGGNGGARGRGGPPASRGQRQIRGRGRGGGAGRGRGRGMARGLGPGPYGNYHDLSANFRPGGQLGPAQSTDSNYPSQLAPEQELGMHDQSYDCGPGYYEQQSYYQGYYDQGYPDYNNPYHPGVDNQEPPPPGSY